MKRIVTLFVLLCVLCMSFACKNDNEVKNHEQTEPPVKSENIPINTTLRPLFVETDIQVNDNFSVEKPVISGVTTAKAINDLITKKVTEATSGELWAVTSVNYEITYNDKGIFSMYFILSGSDENLVRHVPMNINVATGSVIDFSMLFDENSLNWREHIKECAKNSVNKNIRVFGDLTPTDTQGYYLKGDRFVLVYKLYEIATYSAGTPEIEIPYNAVAADLAKDGAAHIIFAN